MPCQAVQRLYSVASDDKNLSVLSLRNEGGTIVLQERLKAIRKEHGGKELGNVTVSMLIGGMRGIPVYPT